MSKPNLLGFSSSLGIYRNKRICDLRRLLSKSLVRKVELSAMAPMFFQVVMAYAGENQIDGNFQDYSTADWCEIFSFNGVSLTPPETNDIIKGFNAVGLLENGKIRSWSKYNRHLGDYESIVRAKRLAGKLSAKKRQLEARESIKKTSETVQKDPQNGEKTVQKTSQNGEKNLEKTVQKDAQKGGQKEGSTTSKELWVVNEGLKTARGKARRELLAKREELIGAITGVDLSSPPPSPAPSSPAAPKQSAKEREESWDRGMLAAGKQAIEDGTPEILTDSMVRAMVNAGYRLPAQVASRFRKLVKEVEADENPVPE